MPERKVLSKKERETREEAFDNALLSLLSDYADVIYPAECLIHGRDRDACECKPEEGSVFMDGLMVREYVLGVAYTGMDTGDSYFTIACPNGMLLSHTFGLMEMMRYQLEERM